MKNIVFYSHGHYGDAFISRMMVRDVMQQLGNDYNYSYALLVNPKVVQDLCPAWDTVAAQQLLSDGSYHLSRLKKSEDTLYINAWIGCYTGMWHSNHPSYHYLYNIYKECYANIEEFAGIKLKINPNFWHYIPQVDYSKFDCSAADTFLADHPKTYLFCNGKVQAHQSGMDQMQASIEILAAKYPHCAFLATEKFSTEVKNIHFTQDVFGMNNDLMEISYLSQHTNLIVGKNSGPFTYSNTLHNLIDTKKIFVCFSNQAVDTLPYLVNVACDFRHSNVTYPYYGVDPHYVVQILSDAIDDEHRGYQTSGVRSV
jgi:hypothetical protein